MLIEKYLLLKFWILEITRE